MITASSLSKSYGDGNIALKRVSFKISKRVTSIIGRNGAGKTTLMRILSTQLLQSSGTATINGYDTRTEPDKIRKMIVSIPQEASPIGYLTPLEHLKMYLVARGMSLQQAGEESRQAIDSLEMRSAANTSTDMLSGGMKRKVFVAMALASNADTIFLDEPTTGLDPVSRLEVWSAIKELKGNMVLTTHYMDEAAELSEDIVMIDSGRVLQHGTVQQMLSKFKGKVRAETMHPDKGARHKIGNTYFSYINIGDSEKYIKKGYSIKRVTLDDLFISRGVEIEP
ncbi:MAG: ABC transporter ATP-binding protein [Candidatus Marsarchaeota archaeon]|nr:ABC transporter ATP-binding protein [Candidatus Marsarchaeota archaeon]